MLVCLSYRYQILREPIHEAVAVGGAYEACGEGVEREGSGKTPAGQARGVAETEFLEARGDHAHQGKARKACFQCDTKSTPDFFQNSYSEKLTYLGKYI